MNEMLPLLLIAGLGLLAYKEGWLSSLMPAATPTATTTILPAAGSPLATAPVTQQSILTPPGSPVQTIQPVVVGTATPSGTVVNPAYTQAAQPAYVAPAYVPPVSSPGQVTPTVVPGEYVVSSGVAGKFTVQQIHDLLFDAVGPEQASENLYSWGYPQWNGLLQQLTGIDLSGGSLPTGMSNASRLMLDGASYSYAYWPWASGELQRLGLSGLRGIGWV